MAPCPVVQRCGSLPPSSRSPVLAGSITRQQGHSHRAVAAAAAANVLVQPSLRSPASRTRTASGEDVPGPSGQQPALEGFAAARINGPGNTSFLEFPARPEWANDGKKEVPLVRVRLSIAYRVHSRQMLCIGGNQIPFGWSFLSIAKVPAVWGPDDIWSAEVELPVGTKIEYKYVILEEQDWTKLENEDAEGLVSYEYRTEPDGPPNVQTIQKQMAIVAWQPGANRVLQVPTAEELNSLRAGETRERKPARPSQRTYPPIHPYSLKNRLLSSTGDQSFSEDELEGTWEELSKDENGTPLLVRRDVWGFADSDRPYRFG